MANTSISPFSLCHRGHRGPFWIEGLQKSLCHDLCWTLLPAIPSSKRITYWIYLNLMFLYNVFGMSSHFFIADLICFKDWLCSLLISDGGVPFKSNAMQALRLELLFHDRPAKKTNRPTPVGRCHGVNSLMVSRCDSRHPTSAALSSWLQGLDGHVGERKASWNSKCCETNFLQLFLWMDYDIFQSTQILPLNSGHRPSQATSSFIGSPLAQHTSVVWLQATSISFSRFSSAPNRQIKGQ